MNKWWVTHAYQQSRHVDPCLHDHCFLPLATRHGHGTGFTPHQRPTNEPATTSPSRTDPVGCCRNQRGSAPSSPATTTRPNEVIGTDAANNPEDSARANLVSAVSDR
jgi:hypothetical protein